VKTRFQKVHPDSHPAAKHVFAFLETLVAKDKQAFEASFGQIEFFAILPGGVKVNSAQKLIFLGAANLVL
jgi:hypothetical protein